MPALTDLLPRPQHASQYQPSQYAVEPTAQAQAPTVAVPALGQRQGFVPVNPEDFGDGGAFPEIHVLQYPLGMGQKNGSRGRRTAPIQVDAEGNIKYEMILHQGHKKSKIIASKYTDLIESSATEEELARPDAEEERKIAEETAAALGQIVNDKVAAAQPTAIKKQNLREATFLMYTPSQQGGGHNSGAKQRVIRLQEMPVDPLEPPKFKHKKIPNGPPSPPVPVMHSPPRKITVEDQQNWKIPPCISNWKNIKGYTIPLDKRLTADGRGLSEIQVNNNFAKLSESLLIAERTARRAIEHRAQLQQKLARQQKEKKEQELRELAARARARGRGEGAREEEDYDAAQGSSSSESESDLDAADERDELRRERRREIKREMRMEKRKAEKTGKIRKVRANKDRDVSERIALGQSVQKSKDTMFDQRLFNQAEGTAAGFGADDDYNVYDKPLFKGSSANVLYKPTVSQDATGDELANVLHKSAGRFRKPDRGFRADSDDEDGPDEARQNRSAPVQFEREEDPFGLGDALTEKKKSKALDKIGSRGSMSANAGGSRLDREEARNSDRRGSSRKRGPDFEESESSRSKRRRG